MSNRLYSQRHSGDYFGRLLDRGKPEPAPVVNVRSGGFSLCSLLTVLFVGLKLTGYIDWSWWWVLSPLWIGLAIGLAILAVIAIVALLAMSAIGLVGLFKK